MDCHVSSASLPRKLTASTSIYDGVFSGSARGARVCSGVEDYAEVFRGRENAGRATIPVLDIPCFWEGRVRVDVRASALDYSAVFGGGAGGFSASSFEEVVGAGAKEGRRVKAKKKSPSQLSNNGLEGGRSVHESSTLSSNEAKRFNVSYNKSHVGSNVKPNGTVRIAQLADIAGYSVLVEESSGLNQTQVDMQPAGEGDAGSHAGVGMMGGVDCKNASSFVSAENSAEKSARKGKDSYGQNLLSNLYSVSLDKKRAANGRLSPRSVSEGVDDAYSLPDLRNELDTNSAAAATAAAVKIAIEKAQARIKAAKEILEGKKIFEFKVSVKKKFDSKHGRGDMKAKKEDLNLRVLHQKVHEEDTRVHSLSGIPKPNLSKEHAVTVEPIDTVKKPASKKPFVVGPEEKRCEAGVDCCKGEFENRELEEDARAEPYPVRDEPVKVVSVKNEIQSYNLQGSNYNRSACRNSAMVVNVETAEDKAPCQEKVNPELLICREAKESEEHIVPFELAATLTAKKENTSAIHTVSEGFKSVNKFAFNFHMRHFEKLPELRIHEPEVDHESQLSVGQTLVNYAADVKANDEDGEIGYNISDEDDKMRRDLGMEIESGEVGEEQERCCDIVNCGIQLEEFRNLEEHGVECNTESLEVVPETGVTEVYDPAIPKERNDLLANKNNGDCQEKRELKESPEHKEDDSIETLLPNGYHEEDLKIHPETCDVKAEKVPPDVKATRRCWMVEAHDVRQLINAVAANACKPNVLEQTADDVMDVVKKEDSDKIMLKNASSLLRDIECVSTEVPSDSITEKKCLDEPIDLVGDTFRNEEMNLEDYGTEAFNSGGATSNLDNACVDSDLTDDEVSERSSGDEAPVRGAFIESEDNMLNESEVSQCSEPESEASVEEAKSETEVEVSGDDFDCEVITGMHQLDNGFAQKEETQIADESSHAKLIIEEVEVKESLRNEMKVEEMHGKNVNENKEKAREKERKAVERVIREARERAYVDARERAERAAVEKATAQTRQRGIAQAQEKVGKSYSEPSNKADDKKLEKAKLKAERAAVERATAEARERALEKALAEKLAAGYKDSKLGNKSNELQHRNSGCSSKSSLPDTSDPNTHRTERSEGDDGESGLRRKARVERHQRTVERAAKALAEKNKRDLLAQREQAERSRLAETLDADIKRWSSGKQGNLRALLSTLQYILGPDSGWQPVTLMEIVSSAAVRKAYRKATLYVHPDKLQQRGASLQQKYICEKVFDLLKDAWNKFSAEER